MKRCALMLLAAAGPMLAPLGQASAAEAVRLEPGNWRVVMKTTTNGVADPPQDEEVCLREDELKDLGKYFAPALEGVQARCTTTRRPSSDKAVIANRLRCKGSNFTYDLDSVVTIASAHRFVMTTRSDARTPRESATVVGNGEATRLGPCNKP